jgi:hypothetical protein
LIFDVGGADISEESCPLREISSVMMTSSGFLSPCREGKMADSKTPHIVPEPEEKQQRPPPPPLLPVSALAGGAVRQLEGGSSKRSADEATGAAADKRPKVSSAPGEVFCKENRTTILSVEFGSGSGPY